MTLTSMRPLPSNAVLHQLTINDARLAVLEVKPQGQEIGTVQFVHGFTGSKEDFWDLAPLVAASGFRVLAHDHRGQNQSDHSSPELYSLAQLASDASEICRELSANNVHLLGHSFGGLVARDAFIDHNHTYRTLTLFCSGPAALVKKTPGLTRLQEELAGKSTKQLWEQLVEIPDSSVAWGPDGDPTSLMSRRWFNSDNNSVIAQAEIIKTAHSRVNEVKVQGKPLHVVYGEFDDAWPIEIQREMANELSADISVIDNTGHCPNEENPPLTAEILTRWWLSKS